jgi:hypothetical protein
VVAIYRVDFPASALGVELGPSRLSEVLDRPDVFAAVPAPAFGPDGPILLLRDLARGVQVASRVPSRGVSFCTEGPGTVARRGGSPTRGCSAAVQSLDPLVEAGAITAPEALDYAARTAIVLRRDGGLTFAASRGATSREFAGEIINSTDGSWAAVTALGESATLATRTGLLLGNADTLADAWLVARRPATSRTAFAPARSSSSDLGPGPGPGPAAPVCVPQSAPQSNGDALQIVVGVGLLAAAAWWWYEDRR